MMTEKMYAYWGYQTYYQAEIGRIQWRLNPEQRHQGISAVVMKRKFQFMKVLLSEKMENMLCSILSEVGQGSGKTELFMTIIGRALHTHIAIIRWDHGNIWRYD